MLKRWFLLLMMLAFVLPLSAQDEAADTPPQTVTLRLTGTTFPGTLDPMLAASVPEVQYVPNLFLGLVRIDPTTGDPVPALAQRWSISLDGLTWIFNLRDDVPWVQHDPVNDTFTEVRKVTADDVAFAVQRVCSSTDNGYYATNVAGRYIAGCADGQAAGDGTLAQVVAAENGLSVSFTLTAPIFAFDAIAALWTLAPVPVEAVTNFPTNWTQPGNLVVSGAFALAERTDNRLTLVANPLFPADLRGEGNVNRVEYTLTDSTAAGFRTYEDGSIDWAAIPAASQERAFSDEALAEEVYELDTLTMFYLGFATDLPPFDDVNLRRAFAASVNREDFIETVRNGRGMPSTHFLPEEVGEAPAAILPETVGYNPTYAQEQLAQSAYPNCEGLPPVTIYTYAGAGGWAGYLVDSVTETLGCSGDVFTIESRSFADLRAAIDPNTPAENRPQMFTFGNSPDYNDASSFANVLACGVDNYFGRQTCTDADDLIQQAATEDVTYRDVVVAFFGEDGVFPMIPLFQLTRYEAVKPWVSGPIETDGLFDQIYFDNYSIDLDARNSAIVCNLSSAVDVNLRSGPGTNFDRVGTLTANTLTAAIAQTQGTDGFIWWQVESSAYVREDVVQEDGFCNALPQAE
jgi:oligopeptide transport system substrate-binding protein